MYCIIESKQEIKHFPSATMNNFIYFFLQMQHNEDDRIWLYKLFYGGLHICTLSFAIVL